MISKKMKLSLKPFNRIVQISIFLLVIATVYVRFYKNHQELPRGCDEFGYLHMAEAIENGKLLESHTYRPFIKDLTNHLNGLGFAKEDYAWVIASHAYHLDASSNKIINQYPVGTSALMSLFPKELRQYFFPVVIALLIYLLVLIVSIKEESVVRSKQFTLVSLFILISVVSVPFLVEYTNVNSVAPTFGLLIATGICFFRNWKLSALLIAISINFRLANVLLYAPIIIYHLILFWKSRNFSSLLKAGIQTVLILLVFGVFPYSLYTKLLLNDFIASTYSSIDQVSANAEMVFVNLKYYFLDENKWLIVNIISLGVFYLLNRKKGGREMLTLSISFLLIYCYFILHAAKTPYYPYGLGLIVIGQIIENISRLDWRPSFVFTLLNSLILIGLVGILSDNYGKYEQSRKTPISLETDSLKECFDSYDVVWGEMQTGTVEYATGVPTMRFYWGTQLLRDKIMQWFQDNNYKQAIYLNDLKIDKNELRRLSKKFNASLNETNNSRCGLLMEL